MSIRRVTYDQEFVRSAYSFEGFDYHVRIVLRLKPGNVEHVAVRFDAPTTHERIRPPLDLSSIRDHRRVSAVAGQIVILNYLGVGDRLGRQNRRHSFSHPIILSGNPIPLLPFVL